MKSQRFLSLSALVLAAAPLISASEITPVEIDSIAFNRSGDFMSLTMNLDFKPTEVKSSRAQILTPLIVSESGDTLALPSVGIYGRQRYLNFLRNDRAGLSRNSETSFRESDRPSDYHYSAVVPFQDWMNGASLIMRRRLFGCANCLIEEKNDPVLSYYALNPGIPEILYFEAKDMGPVVESLEGSAYIDFIVDKTNIEPNYRRNPQELLKIQESIDTVLNDPDVTITSVWLKGFASPESPYSHNTDLAIGRTAALKKHIGQLYNFRDDLISTDYEPEDWEGLRRFVENSNIDHKAEILEMINSDMEPDAKEALIKKTFPQEYKFMLDNFYPALRHTEYRITYEVKRFDDLDKIRQVMRTKPNRLTLREFYLLGNSVAPGSDEFNDVYETAARIYPDDPIANLNAANAAIQRKDFDSAEKYLSRAGESDEVTYAKGALAFSRGDYSTAEDYMKQLPQLPKAVNTLKEIDRIRESKVEKPIKFTLE